MLIMNKLRLLPVLLFALLVVLVTSCKKEDDKLNGGTGNTDLQVYVFNANSTPTSGAIVSLYTSQADRDAGTSLVNSGVTGQKGFVYFSDLPTFTYYVSVSYNNGATIKTGKSDTGVPIKEKEQSALTVVLE